MLGWMMVCDKNTKKVVQGTKVQSSNLEQKKGLLEENPIESNKTVTPKSKSEITGKFQDTEGHPKRDASGPHKGLTGHRWN